MSDGFAQAVLSAADRIERELGTPDPDPSLSALPEREDPLIHQLVYSVLLWESSHEQARASLGVIMEQTTGYNELRVCSADEVAGMLAKDAHRDERADRILAALNSIFDRNHALSLGDPAALQKREARAAFDRVEGLPQFVTARMMLVTLGGHAFPADSRIARSLAGLGVTVPDDASDTDLGSRLERAIRAADAARVYALLEHHAASSPSTGGKPRTAANRGGKRSPRRSKPEAPNTGNDT